MTRQTFLRRLRKVKKNFVSIRTGEFIRLYSSYNTFCPLTAVMWDGSERNTPRMTTADVDASKNLGLSLKDGSDIMAAADKPDDPKNRRLANALIRALS